MGQLSVASGGRSTAVGYATQAGERATAVGESAQATAFAATAIGFEANSSHVRSTAVGANATTTEDDQLVLGGAGSSVRVGDIDASTEAQTSQLFAVTVDGDETLGRGSAVASVDNSLRQLAAVSDAQFAALEGRVTSLFDLTETMDRDAQRGIASIAAQANPHFPSEAGKSSYASNVAAYRGEIGFSAGVMHRLEGDFALTAGVSYAGGNSTAVRAGIAGEF